MNEILWEPAKNGKGNNDEKSRFEHGTFSAYTLLRTVFTLARKVTELNKGLNELV